MKKLITYICLVLFIGIVLVGCLKGSDIIVSKVYDGDSFVLSNGDGVRLIGIDAPERDQPGAEEARSFLIGLIEGKHIRLEPDKENKDKYNRLLRYAYINDTFINAEMIKQGYATTLFIPPNDRYKSEFTQLEKAAKENKKGLWATGGFINVSKVTEVSEGDIISWQEAGKYLGQIKTVEGVIVRTHNSGKACFLDFNTDKKSLSIVIMAGNFNKFPKPLEGIYLNKKVQIEGLIKKYKGHPEIVISDPAQIKIIK